MPLPAGRPSNTATITEHPPIVKNIILWKRFSPAAAASSTTLNVASDSQSEVTQSRLLFVQEALRRLQADDDFATLLRAERLDTMPADMGRRIAGDAA